MEPRISIITLGVRDLDRSVRFYRDGLGLPVRSETAELVWFQCGGAILAIWARESLAADAGVEEAGSGFRGVSLAHNVRSRQAVDEALAEAERAGARITMPAHDADWGGYTGYFTDPDDHIWEVAWNPHSLGPAE